MTWGVEICHITCLNSSFDQICRSYLANWSNGSNEKSLWHEFTAGWFWLRSYVKGFTMDGSGYVLALLTCVKSKYFHQIEIKKILSFLSIWLEYAWVQEIHGINLWVLFDLPNFVFFEVFHELLVDLKALICLNLTFGLLKFRKFCLSKGQNKLKLM